VASIAHNTAINHSTSRGAGFVAIISNASPDRTFLSSNLAALNSGRDMIIQGDGSQFSSSSNWLEDDKGQPGLRNPSFQPDTAFPETLNTVRLRRDWLHRQVIEAVSPTPDSDLIDASQLIPGVHCATADDDSENPMDPREDCRHWLGAAPDIGAIEVQ
jgi:hypothetical protein